MHNLVVFSIFTELYTYQRSSQIFSLTPKEIPYPVEVTPSPFYPLTTLIYFLSL